MTLVGRFLTCGLAISVAGGMFGGTASFAQGASGKLVMGVSHSSRYGDAIDLSFVGDDLGGVGINVDLDWKEGREGRRLSFGVEKEFERGDTVFGKDTFVYVSTTGQQSRWDTDTFHSTSVGLNFGVNAALSAQSRYSAGMFWRRDEIDNFDAGTSALITQYAGETDAAGITLGYNWDSYNRFGPLEVGSSASLDVNLAGLGNSREYQSAALRAQTTRPFIGPSVYELSVNAGGINGSGAIHMVDRAFGSGGKPRGFAYGGITPFDASTGDALGGTRYFSASAEALMPVGQRGVAMGLFYDVGAIWSLPGVSDPNVDDGFSLRSSVGLSLKWAIKHGYLNISFAKPIKHLDTDDLNTFAASFETKF